jgi:hypothetical protein
MPSSKIFSAGQQPGFSGQNGPSFFGLRFTACQISEKPLYEAELGRQQHGTSDGTPLTDPSAIAERAEKSPPSSLVSLHALIVVGKLRIKDVLTVRRSERRGAGGVAW